MRPAHEGFTDELLSAFSLTDSLDTFRRLPLADQEDFYRWIEKAPDEEARWRRIDALTLAIRISCLRLHEQPGHAPETGSPAPERPKQEPRGRSAAAERVMKEVEDPALFNVLENVIDEFLRARDDASIRETLEIAEAFLTALRESECLDLFALLPVEDQARFLRWIGSTTPAEFRLRRIETFVSALKASPMNLGTTPPSD